MEIKFEDLPPLQKVCEKCNGLGRKAYCYHCYSGMVTTEFGQEILDFIKWFSPWKEAVDEIQSDLNRMARNYED